MSYQHETKFTGHNCKETEVRFDDEEGNMARLIVAMTFLVLGVAQAADFFALRTVNLGASGTIEELRRNNPVHYEKVRQIMAGLPERYDVEKWIRTSFNATNVQYTPLLLVTDPPKRRLSFTIDDTRYEALITTTNFPGR